MIGRHINIRVICCGMCPYAELETPSSALLIAQWSVKCNDLKCAVGTVETVMRGIYDQCRFTKITDIKDIID